VESSGHCLICLSHFRLKRSNFPPWYLVHSRSSLRFIGAIICCPITTLASSSDTLNLFLGDAYAAFPSSVTVTSFDGAANLSPSIDQSPPSPPFLTWPSAHSFLPDRQRRFVYSQKPRERFCCVNFPLCPSDSAFSSHLCDPSHPRKLPVALLDSRSCWSFFAPFCPSFGREASYNGCNLALLSNMVEERLFQDVAPIDCPSHVPALKSPGLPPFVMFSILFGMTVTNDEAKSVLFGPFTATPSPSRVRM